MSYDEYPELWEEATETAEECSECEIKSLDVPKGESQHYKFCKKHHRKFYREYIIRRQKGKKGKDDLTLEDVAEGLSKATGQEFTTPGKTYSSTDIEELKDGALEKFRNESKKTAHLETLANIGELDPRLIDPHADELLRFILSNIESRGGSSKFINTSSQLLSFFQTHQDRELREKAYNWCEKGDTAYNKTWKPKLGGRFFVELFERQPEFIFERLDRTLIDKLKRENPRQIDKIADILTGCNWENRYFPLSDFTRLFYEISEKYPKVAEDYRSELLEFLEPDYDKRNYGVYHSGFYNLLKTFANIYKVSEPQEEELEKIKGFLDYEQLKSEGKNRDLACIASAALLFAGKNNENYLENVREMADMSIYREAKVRDAVEVLGYFGNEEDIERFKCWKTPYSPSDFREAVDDAVFRIKVRNASGE